MKIYKSKIDWWLLVVFLLPLYFGITGVGTNKILGTTITISTIAFVVFMYRSTYYIIDHNQLIIRSMLLVHEKIEITSIKKIYKTKNPLSSPALSLDRIAIVYNTYDEIMISPLEKKQFVEELLKINPEIISFSF